MKNRVALATLAMLPLAVSSVSAASQMGVVTTNVLNIRSGPSTKHTIISKAKKNEQVTILESSNGWYKVKLKSGKEGWASGSYIKKTTTDNNTNPNPSSNKKQVSTNGLNMRSGAGTSYRVITVLKKGQAVEVISESKGWSKIKHDGRLGYVSSQYLANINNNGDNNNNNNTNIKTKEVNTASLNVRSGPSTSNGIVGKLKNGQKVEVISESNGWSKIKYNGKEAYVSSTYLKDVSQPPTPTPPPTPEPPAPEIPGDNNTNVTTKEVNTASLNVRSGPGTNYSIVGKLKNGEKVEVISESNGWSKIKYNGKEAYTSSMYLKDVSQEPTPPTTPETPGDNNQNNGDHTVENKVLNYTLGDHVNKQHERVSVGGNVIDSSKPRSSEVLTTFRIRESRAFIPADVNDLEYFLNPNNFKNTAKGMMQFLRIDSYKGGVSEGELNYYLNSLAPASSGTNVFYNQGGAFIKAAEKYNLDLAYLVSHAMWETGYGRSTLAQGQTITSYKGQPLPAPVTVYNFYGIGAIDQSANVSGAEAAYSNGWTSIEATIDGSAQWISNGYIKSAKYNQNTIYKMKWNYDYTWHQYATDVNWANGISGIMNNIIKMYDTSNNLKFEIPQYR